MKEYKLTEFEWNAGRYGKYKRVAYRIVQGTTTIAVIYGGKAIAEKLTACLNKNGNGNNQ